MLCALLIKPFLRKGYVLVELPGCGEKTWSEEVRDTEKRLILSAVGGRVTEEGSPER